MSIIIEEDLNTVPSPDSPLNVNLENQEQICQDIESFNLNQSQILMPTHCHESSSQQLLQQNIIKIKDILNYKTISENNYQIDLSENIQESISNLNQLIENAKIQLNQQNNTDKLKVQQLFERKFLENKENYSKLQNCKQFPLKTYLQGKTSCMPTFNNSTHGKSSCQPLSGKISCQKVEIKQQYACPKISFNSKPIQKIIQKPTIFTPNKFNSKPIQDQKSNQKQPETFQKPRFTHQSRPNAPIKKPDFSHIQSKVFQNIPNFNANKTIKKQPCYSVQKF